MTEIVYCTENDAERWNDFLDGCPDSSFYHLHGWKSINEEYFGHSCYYLAVQKAGEMIGILPLVYVKSRLFGKILCSLPFVNYGGLCCREPEAERRLLAEAQRLVERLGAAYLELRGTREVGERLPTLKHKVSMMLELNPEPETIWAAFKSKQRTEIRRAERNELEVESGGIELLAPFYAVLAKGWHGHGTPLYRKDYFAAILTAFPEQTRIFIVRHHDRPVATAFNGFYRGSVEGMWLGIDPRYRHLNANTLLYWEMIKDACLRQMNIFHFGRSSVDSGGEFFKKKWNATPRQLYWQYILGTMRSTPRLNVDNPRYRLASRVWRRMPLSLTTMIGPMIARSIP